MRCRTDETLRHVQFLTRRINKEDISSVILIILIEMGFSPHHDGFVYLRKCIEMNLEDPRRMVTKDLYPCVAKFFGCYDWRTIEQAIRSTIKCGWDTRNEELWESFFPIGRDGKLKCPSNKEFIAKVTCILELWLSCEEASYERI